MKNILTFDIEDWYHPNLANKDLLGKGPFDDRVETPTLLILNILDETHNKATFFVVGDVAEKFPDLVREIIHRGHEVASHGYRHNLVYDYTKAQFETDLGNSVRLLEKITGRKILGYRAPSWSLGEKTPWAWQCMNELGLQYDSSLYPYKTFLYGDSTARRFEYDIDLSNDTALREIPPSVAELLGRRVPFSGGFFFRVVPYAFLTAGIQQYNRAGQPAVIYLHPWELDVEQPRLKPALLKRFILYANLERTEKKLRRLLSDFNFISVQEHLCLTDAKQQLQPIPSAAEPA